ncbi:DUF3067 family protein [Vulcanococcus sp.]|uniref:DUF3067 family protein n=1 Tax=Vulcanococcus sp. TaxID=2856995 RepID=UPI003231F791
MAEPIADPLTAEELLQLLRSRWQASYDVQLVVRRGRLYFQVMWAYLEQQSFPLDAAGYQAKLEEVVSTLNGIGAGELVRSWLNTTSDKPRLGKALNLALEWPEGRSSEFVL